MADIYINHIIDYFMKHSLVLYVLLLILCSCNGDNGLNESEEQIVLTEINDEILSVWRLDAYLFDPGDGSGDAAGDGSGDAAGDGSGDGTGVGVDDTQLA